MMKKSQFFTIISALCFSIFMSNGVAYSISDEEHLSYMNASREYLKYDLDMNAIYKQLKKALPKAEFEVVQASQIGWANNRDFEVQNRLKNLPRLDAYTQVALERLIELSEKYNLNNEYRYKEQLKRTDRIGDLLRSGAHECRNIHVGEKYEDLGIVVYINFFRKEFEFLLSGKLHDEKCFGNMSYKD